MSIYEDTFLTVYFCVIAAILGASLGSFLNCAAWRIAREESFLSGRSRCPACGHELGVLDLIPVFSWLFLKGRCRYCKADVSWRYPLAECIFACLTVICLLKFDLSFVFLRNLIFICCMFCLSLVDMEKLIIPDGCLLIAVGAWMLGAFVVPEYGGIHNVLAGLVIGGAVLIISLIMDRCLGRESLGGGDIKLFAVMGLYLGFVGGMLCLILSCVLGLLFAAVTKKGLSVEGTSGQIPFGPAIATSTCIMLLFGSGLIDWYMGFFI